MVQGSCSQAAALIAFFLLGEAIVAQTTTPGAVVPAGGSGTANGTTLSWTIGQALSATLISDSVAFTAGVQQPEGVQLTLNIAVLKFKTDQIGKGMDFTGVHHFGVLVEDADKATAQLEALGAECFMGKDKGHGKGFFEIKFKGPDGTVFDIAEHPWMGSRPHDA